MCACQVGKGPTRPCFTTGLLSPSTACKPALETYGCCRP
jgi:hypothetical protein